MTREEFDGHLNKTLRNLARSFNRPDVVAIFDSAIEALDVAILAAERLAVKPEELS